MFYFESDFMRKVKSQTFFESHFSIEIKIFVLQTPT